MLNRNSESGHTGLVPDLRGKLSLFPIQYDAGWGFPQMPFITFEKVPLFIVC